MNQIFSTQDGLCIGFTDDDFQQKMLVFKYNPELGKLGVGLMDGDKVLGKFTLDPKTTCKVIADYFDSMRAFDLHAHPVSDGQEYTGEGPAEGQLATEGQGPAEGQQETTGEGLAEGQQEAEGKGPAEGQPAAEGQGLTEGQQETEGTMNEGPAAERQA